MTNERMVDWTHSREYFDRVVEAVVQRIWSKADDAEVNVIDGRGGDDGLDIFVTHGGVTTHVYQLKFFPQGMSGGFSARRKQVKRSFASVSDLEGLREWTLIVPRNPTVPELKSVNAMASGRDLRVRVWGQAALDAELARFPDLLAWAQRNDLVTTLRAAAHEKAALTGPHDYGDRLAALHVLADSRSAFWGETTVIEADTITHTLFAKRPDAAEKEPIAFQFTPTFGPEHTALETRYRRAIEFGSSEAVDLPPEIVGKFSISGPEWIAAEGTNYGVQIGPAGDNPNVAAELRMIRPGGGYLASLSGTVTFISRGTKGHSMTAEFSGLQMVFRRPNDGDIGEAEMSWEVTGRDATSARKLMNTMRFFDQGEDFELFVNGSSLFRSGGYAPAPENRVDSLLWEVVDDLAMLEDSYSVSFIVPEEITGRDRVLARVARLLTEGRVTSSPECRAMTAVHSGEIAPPSEIDVLDGEPRAMRMRNPNHVLNVLGQNLHVGSLMSYHPSLAVRDAPERAAQIARGEGKGMRVIFEPTDGTPVRLWLEDRYTGSPDKPMELTPWHLEGIPETDGVLDG